MASSQVMFTKFTKADCLSGESIVKYNKVFLANNSPKYYVSVKWFLPNFELHVGVLKSQLFSIGDKNQRKWYLKFNVTKEMVFSNSYKLSLSVISKEENAKIEYEEGYIFGIKNYDFKTVDYSYFNCGLKFFTSTDCIQGKKISGIVCYFTIYYPEHINEIPAISLSDASTKSDKKDETESKTFNIENYLEDNFESMYGSELFSDLTLIIKKEHKIKVHKFILAARCPYFLNKFKENPNLNEFEINDLVYHIIIEKVIKYLYTGKINDLSIREVACVLAVADKFLLEKLKFNCQEILIKNIDINNVNFFLEAANLSNASYLKEKIINFVTENSDKLDIKISLK